MSEELIVRHGSPTLAGLKTGSLFSWACPDGAGGRLSRQRGTVPLPSLKGVDFP